MYEGRVETAGGLTRRVAIKLLRDDIADEQTVARTIDEAHLLARLNHPGVVGVEDLVRVDGRLAILSEFVEGADLAEVGPLPAGAAIDVTARVAEALYAAWASAGPDGEPLRIVHRDIKPSNVRLGRGGVVKLLDFGIARASEGPRRANTGTGLMVGSLGYIAPERWLSDRADHASDVYALGCVLFESLTGDPLFLGLPAVRQVGLMQTAEMHDEFVRDRMDESECRGPVRELLDRMLRWDPDARPTARDVARSCRRLAAGLEGDIVGWSGNIELGNTHDWSRAEGKVLTETDKGFVVPDTLARAVPTPPPPAIPDEEFEPERSRGGLGWALAVFGGGALMALLALGTLGTAGGLYATGALDEVLGTGSSSRAGAAHADDLSETGAADVDAGGGVPEPPDEVDPGAGGADEPEVDDGEREPDGASDEATATRDAPPAVGRGEVASDQPAGTTAGRPAAVTSTAPIAASALTPSPSDSTSSPPADPGTPEGGPTLIIREAEPERVIVPRSEPVQKKPEPPAAPTLASILVTGEGTARLVRNGRTWNLPGSVPTGSYTLEASFGGGPYRVVGPLEVREAMTLMCPARFRHCTVR